MTRLELFDYADKFLNENLHNYFSDKEKIQCVDFAEWLFQQLENKPKSIYCDCIIPKPIDPYDPIDKQCLPTQGHFTEKKVCGCIDFMIEKLAVIVKPSRCCGRCDGVHDICVTDQICEEHNAQGCEICFGKI